MYGDFVGLDDLFTEQPDVVDGMIDIYKTWVEFGIDGFRIDTVKHVNMEFWQEFAPAIRGPRPPRRQRRLLHLRRGLRRQPGLHCPRSRPRAGSRRRWTSASRAPAPASPRARPTTELRDFFADDDYYTDADSNAYSCRRSSATTTWAASAIFLDAATPTTGARARRAGARADVPHPRPAGRLLRRRAGLHRRRRRPGRPRRTCSPARWRSYNDDDLIGTDATTAEDNFDTDHPLYQHDPRPVARCGRRTRRSPTARRSTATPPTRPASTPSAGSTPRSGREYVVALNNATTARTVTLDTDDAPRAVHSRCGRRPVASAQDRRGAARDA